MNIECVEDKPNTDNVVQDESCIESIEISPYASSVNSFYFNVSTRVDTPYSFIKVVGIANNIDDLKEPPQDSILGAAPSEPDKRGNSLVFEIPKDFPFTKDSYENLVLYLRHYSSSIDSIVNTHALSRDLEEHELKMLIQIIDALDEISTP